MNRRTLAVALLVLPPRVLAAQRTCDLPRIHAVIADVQSRQQNVGVAVAVLRDGKPAYEDYLVSPCFPIRASSSRR